MPGKLEIIFVELPCPMDSPILICDDLIVSPGGSFSLTDPLTTTCWDCGLVRAYSLTSISGNCRSTLSSLGCLRKGLVSLQKKKQDQLFYLVKHIHAHIFLRTLSINLEGLNFLYILMHPAMMTLVRIVNIKTVESEMTEMTTFLETNYRQTLHYNNILTKLMTYECKLFHLHHILLYNGRQNFHPCLCIYHV